MSNFFESLGHHTRTNNQGKKALDTVQLGVFRYQNGTKHNIGPGVGTRTLYITIPARPSEVAYPTWDGQKPVTQKVEIDSASSNSRPGPTGGSGGVTWRAEDSVALSMASAFATQLEFPTTYLDAMLLQGYKAYENDITCLEGIEQFCKASLRSFMSLPDGRFLAFYPDYFGAHGRGPYWNIYDIEIVNAGVNLSDIPLATHVYTTGDVSGADGEINYMDRWVSRGAVTLDMPLLLRSFIQPGITAESADNIKQLGWAPGNIRTAYDFYNHFGVRVYKEDVPIIRNTYYEFLYAWQRMMMKWAETFQTTVDFTFQPEVMAGGIIGFPQHNLQMYVSSVTHSWDYGSGFRTEAELMAPAAISQHKKGDIGSLPGFAIGGNVNSVGTAGG